MSRRFLGLTIGVVGAGLLWAPAGRSQAPAETARAEAAATITRYCVTCHSERLKTAGVVLDPASLARVGDKAELWEKVLHQLRSSTMPPPGATRPDQGAYGRVAAYLDRELAASAARNPNPGELSPVHRLTHRPARLQNAPNNERGSFTHHPAFLHRSRHGTWA